MKHPILLWILAGILSFILDFAPVLSFADDSNAKDKSGKVSESKTLSHFTRIVLSGIGNLYIKQSKEENLLVKAEAYLLPNIQATVKDETLYIDFKNASDYSRSEISYYLSIKDLKSIQSSSSASINIEEGLVTDELTLEIKSFGEMNVKQLQVNKLIAKIEGAGKIKATGRAKVQEVYILGAGEFLGSDLKGDSVSVNITETGAAKVNSENNLTVAIPKEGTVRYCGSPSVSKEVSDKAVVEQLPKQDC